MINLKILAIEDVPNSFLGPFGELQDQGYQIKIVGSIEEGISALTDNEFDIMLLDWRLPRKAHNGHIDDKGGEAVIDSMLKGVCKEWNKKIPFIVITGQNPATNIEICKKLPGYIGTIGKLNLLSFDDYFKRAVEQANDRRSKS
ncbi:MAG: hypothetical protein ABR936_15645 [Bacteroidota bacterium]|jgi:CheY-like chemotaxis protein